MAKAKLTGEKQIATILKELNVDFQDDKKLFLKKDTKKYRVPDFYLPKYDLVIEYFGSWNNKKSKKIQEKERKRFMEKVGVYETSGINCIYLYPDDLVNAKKIIEEKLKSFEKPKIVVKKEEVKTINKLEEEIPEQIVEKKVVREIKIIPSNEEKMIFEEDLMEQKEEKPKKTKTIDSPVKQILIYNILLVELLFVALIILLLITFSQGNPLVNPLGEVYEITYLLFVLAAVVSIVLSIIFAVQKELSKGLIIVGLILIVFYVLTMFFFGDPFARTITILVTALAIAPSEYYMTTSN